MRLCLSLDLSSNWQEFTQHHQVPNSMPDSEEIHQQRQALRRAFPNMGAGPGLQVQTVGPASDSRLTSNPTSTTCQQSRLG